MDNSEIEAEVIRLAEDHTEIELLGLIAGDEIGRDEENEEDAAYIADLWERYGLKPGTDLIDALNTICLSVEMIGKRSLNDAEWQIDKIEVTTGVGGPGTWFVVEYGGDVTSYASWSGPESSSYAGNYPELWTALSEMAEL